MCTTVGSSEWVLDEMSTYSFTLYTTPLCPWLGMKILLNCDTVSPSSNCSSECSVCFPIKTPWLASDGNESAIF